MSLRSQPIGAIPEETIRVARAAFPRGHLCLTLRDELGSIFMDECFAALFPRRGQPATPPWRLAVVTLLQYAEGLSDRQAADSVRGRIDWKYLLGLELTDPGFDYSVLSEFRTRLLSGGAEARVLDLLLEQCKAQGLLRERGRQRTDSTHVLARIRAMNRLECADETMRHALNTLAVAAPDWLRLHCPPEWVERYARPLDSHRLPKSEAKRRARAEQIGTDGHQLLAHLAQVDAPKLMRQISAVEMLRRVWIQQFWVTGTEVHWRTEQEGIPPSSIFINSPHDVDAHYARKYDNSWIGYKVHLTESCEEDLPHLITHVETSPAPAADGDQTPSIHRTLREKGLLPGIHLVDTGYLDAQLLTESREEYDVDLLGPTRPDYHWQAAAARGFAASDFQIDWEHQQATCPAGRKSLSWTPAVDRRTNEVVKIKFSMRDCGACAHKQDCTRGQRRTVTVRAEPKYFALEAAREREGTRDFKSEYARRAGVEGTISQAVRVLELRRARYIGQAKTHLEHLLAAAALNLLRLGAWFTGRSRERTRTPAFVRIMLQPGHA